MRCQLNSHHCKILDNHPIQSKQKEITVSFIYETHKIIAYECHFQLFEKYNDEI